MAKKDMLAILGSPHINGITATMLDYAVSKAEELGYEVKKINLYDMDLGYCKGCRTCLDTEVCAQKDDIQDIVASVQKCQTVLLAAPVYWANVPAAVKNLFDRLLGTAMFETRAFPAPRLKGKEYMLLTSCNTPFPFSWIFGQSRKAIGAMDEFFKTAGMKPIGKIVCAGATAKKELSARTIKKIQNRLIAHNKRKK